jgi:hypothetical protein
VKVQNEILKSIGCPIKNNKTATAGMTIVLNLVDLGFKPHIYGFTHTLDKDYVTYSWKDVTRDKSKNPYHNFENEYHIMSYLIAKNLVVLHN